MERELAKASDTQTQKPNENLQQLALSSYHVCKDGSVVSNPRDCWKTNLLPEMHITGLAKS